MKYAVSYARNFRYLDEVDEIVFHCRKEGDIEKMVDTIPDLVREGQTAIIDYTDFTDLDKYIPALVKLQQDIDIKMFIHLHNTKLDVIEKLKKNKIKYMFFPYAYSKETFFEQKELGASDIYVVEELGFSLQHIDEEDVNIRFFPDVAQAGAYLKRPIAIKTFWVRPEGMGDIKADICEFYHSGDSLNVIYEVYKQEQWLGDLNDIIADLGESIQNTGITPAFDNIRTACNHKCMISDCDYCIQVKNTCDKFKEAGLEIRQKRKKRELTPEQKEQLMKKITKESEKDEPGSD